MNNQQGHSNVYMRDGNLYASKFGLRGDEDLGGGTHAIFDLQSGFNLNNGAQSAAGLIFNRQAFVGLRNDHYGTMTAGRQYTPYFLFVGPYASSSWLTGATGAHPGDIDGLDTTTRVNNSVTYTSPTFAGLTASAMYAFGGIAGATGKGNVQRRAALCERADRRRGRLPAHQQLARRQASRIRRPPRRAASRYPC